MIIAINGSLGSGKTTVAKLIAQELGFVYVSTGKWFRELAVEKNLSVTELNLIAEKDASIDEYIDEKLKEHNHFDGNFVIDSRMAPFFIEEALKIRIIVDEKEGAKRIFCDNSRGQDEKYCDLAQAVDQYRVRSKSEKERYLRIYGIDTENVENYELVLDSTNLSPIEIASKITSIIKNKLSR